MGEVRSERHEVGGRHRHEVRTLLIFHRFLSYLITGGLNRFWFSLATSSHFFTILH